MPKPLLHNSFCAQLDIKWPLIQAPMGGGPTTPALVAAVSNAGGLGSLGVAYLTPQSIEQTIKETQRLTQHPFSVNLFAPANTPILNQEAIDAACDATRGYRQELDLLEPSLQAPFAENFEEQFTSVLRCRPAALSYTFGLINKELLQECHQQKIFTMGTATTVEEGLTLQEYGVDAVIAQGAEAGGHRGTFTPEQHDSLIGTFALTRLLSQSLKIPVIASGGIMDGHGIVAALTLGAQAAQLGTAFLLCDEAGTSAAYRDALNHAQDKDTRLTRAFSGRWARGIPNRFMLEMEDSPILPFPAQNVFTRDIRKKAADLGKAEYLSLWAGQGVNLIRRMDASQLVHTLYQEALDALPAPSK
ncbi:nitronate monooxygenase [Legionella lytica]|uniref:Propionate 3-nitronate monooxygenase n=1 Tax=Legionella lytica TaxID=96232 RepID=A0ABY4YAR8_9GAMM|nr:nitronate monooxygenase [Legionella lytica]USQ14315.1 nitronate monooxygenase [Legionella lytica]